VSSGNGYAPSSSNVRTVRTCPFLRHSKSAHSYRSVQFSISGQLLHRKVQRFRGGLVVKAHRLCASLNFWLESNKEEERSLQSPETLQVSSLHTTTPSLFCTRELGGCPAPQPALGLAKVQRLANVTCASPGNPWQHAQADGGAVRLGFGERREGPCGVVERSPARKEGVRVVHVRTTLHLPPHLSSVCEREREGPSGSRPHHASPASAPVECVCERERGSEWFTSAPRFTCLRTCPKVYGAFRF